MRISRKQAVFGSVTLLLVWFGARAIASPSEVTVVASVPLQTEVADLRNQVQQLQAIVANQVGFTKNANGDLSLAGTGHVTITATTLDLKSSQASTLEAASNLTFRGQSVTVTGSDTVLISGATGATIRGSKGSASY